MLFELFVKVLANILVAVLIGILAIILVLPVLGIFTWFDKLKRKRKARQKEQALESMLSGRSLETVLEKSPYKHIFFFRAIMVIEFMTTVIGMTTRTSLFLFIG